MMTVSATCMFHKLAEGTKKISLECSVHQFYNVTFLAVFNNRECKKWTNRGTYSSLTGPQLTVHTLTSVYK